MNHPGALIQRFLFALGGVAAVALLFYRTVLLERRDELSELIALGVLAAALLALVCEERPRLAMVTAAIVVPVRLAFSGATPGGSQEIAQRIADSWLGSLIGNQALASILSREWVTDVVGGLSTGFGVLAVALMFHSLSESGWRLGKFFLVGPLMGLLCVALVPMEQLSEAIPAVTGIHLALGFKVGAIAGWGAGFGAELYDLLGPTPTAEPTGAREL